MIIIIDSIDRVGKTTLATKLAENLNGKIYKQKTLNITDKMIKNGKIEIEVEAVKSNKVDLIIYEISTRSSSDWMRFYNASDDKIDINKYFISDKYENLKKYQLPNIDLQPYEHIIINGKNNYYAIGDYICNFNLNEMETLYLYSEEDNKIVSSLEIPYMKEHETYGRYLNSNTFVYYDNRQNQRKNLIR